MSHGTVHSLIAAAALAYLPAATLRAATAEDFITQHGDDPTFEEVMKSGDVPRGTNSTKGFKGSTVRVNHDLLKDSPDARRKIPDAIKIHTLGHSAIRRGDFPKWTRWYQEDGNTQVFRLFKGEENVRNDRDLAARVEAFSELSWKKGEWHEWVGTYTIIKPHGCAIFQAKNNENDWSVQLNMSADGDVTLNHRRGSDQVIARNMVGKPFHIRVRDNGLDYEVFLNGKAVGKGSYARPQGETTFRWGMYLGGNEVKSDAMILVTGAGIDEKGYDEESASALASLGEQSRPEPKQLPGKEPAEPEEEVDEDALRIPERDWTNKKGVAVRAVGLYSPGKDFVKLRLKGEWVVYPLDDLADKDRKELLMALDIIE